MIAVVVAIVILIILIIVMIKIEIIIMPKQSYKLLHMVEYGLKPVRATKRQIKSDNSNNTKLN